MFFTNSTSKKLLIANTYFDLGLAGRDIPLYQQLSFNKVCNKLQYLPLLIASSQDIVLVDNYFKLPKLPDFITLPKISRIDAFKHEGDELFSPWGVSPSVIKWAKQHQLSLETPAYSIIKKANSKLFSSSICALPHSHIIYDIKDLKQVLDTFPYASFVLKHPFGVSARGNYVHTKQVLNTAVYAAMEKKLETSPFCLEPWMNRKVDFSTQWELTQQGECILLAFILLHNHPKGSTRTLISGPFDQLFPKTYHSFLYRAVEKARYLLGMWKNIGYFGPLGIDGMIYEDPLSHQLHLHPMLEVNARVSLGRIALFFQQQYFKNKVLEQSFYPHFNIKL